MTTQEKIAKIVKDQYGNFNGRLMQPLKRVHDLMRTKMSDEQYLEFIEKQTKENPRPVYQIPEILKIK